MVLVIWARFFESEWYRNHSKIWSGGRFLNIWDAFSCCREQPVLLEKRICINLLPRTAAFVEKLASNVIFFNSYMAHCVLQGSSCSTQFWAGVRWAKLFGSRVTIVWGVKITVMSTWGGVLNSPLESAMKTLDIWWTLVIQLLRTVVGSQFFC